MKFPEDVGVQAKKNLQWEVRGMDIFWNNTIPACVYKFVYIIGLHAVQFGYNWIQKIPRTAQIWLSEEFFESNYFQNGQACGPLTY